MAASTIGSIFANVGSASRPDNGVVTNNNRDYKVLIDVETTEQIKYAAGNSSIFPIEANLPERFHLELNSSWGMPFAQGGAEGIGEAVAGGLGAAAVQLASSATGVGTRAKQQFVQVWENTSPLQINLDLIFYAQQNTDREIKQRHLALLKLLAPSTINDTMLVAPGPRLVGSSLLDGTEGRKITVYIGRYVRLKNCLIKSVGSDVVTMMDKDGIPIAMTINIGIETWNAAVTTEDLEDMFYGDRTWPSS